MRTMHIQIGFQEVSRQLFLIGRLQASEIYYSPMTAQVPVSLLFAGERVKVQLPPA